ncbi:5'-adenylylsulfate reductase-like 4 [Papaver somniferum]|uniref:5'-adenylylsulfate reductase-like 4 n=1 Tax=Papaver somniferum TaxID=3469 RepID=UPI000E6FC68F|nr:5'-adenylylsulfate reductase-like 4 [Papaver somniferum]
MANRVSRNLGFFWFFCYGVLVLCCESSVGSLDNDVCPVISMKDSILKAADICVDFDFDFATQIDLVIEGNDVSLKKALNVVQKNGDGYVAVLFYASWCPFSRSIRPTFSALSSLYPSIQHLAIEESAVMPSVLSIYGVHGFPTLFLFNSTMRMRYHGPRSLSFLVDLYSHVTGMKSVLLDETSWEKLDDPSVLVKLEDTKEESYRFSWIKSPEKLLNEEKYLALTSVFVVLRLVYFFLPSLLACVSTAWRRLILNTRIVSLWEYPSTLFSQAMQIFRTLKEPCKRRSNLQERAIHARTWARKSFASVSISDAAASSSRVSEIR